ncbi:MAG: YheV family putative metal-binding protein [Halomonadaceae bacterium]|nr:MAG: YheV family putative metal-binding protein [Halomonadaceae bacterium]
MKKRFIAGAVCPRCSEMDRIVMYSSEENTYQECVSCGYRDRQPTAEEMAQAAELETRVRHKPRAINTPAQPIKFFPQKPKETRH